MLIVKLQGGLGNQMFQYAAVRGLAKIQHFVYLDHHFLEQNNTDEEHFTARAYELSIFKNLKAQKARNWQIDLFKSPSKCYRFLRACFGTKAAEVKQHENELIDTAALNKKSILYLDGYFQSENYFRNIRPEILKDFKFPQLDPGNQRLEDMILNTPQTVSVHIRRGDYVKSPVVMDVHGVLPLSYYYTALSALREKYGKLTLLVFSDDIDWARENLKDDTSIIYFVNNNKGADSWKDMALMSFCRHHIIANSSFSWWGAWLSEHNGDTFAPYNWFNNAKVTFEIKDIVPEHWTII